MKSEAGRRFFWNLAKASTKTKKVVAAKWGLVDYVGLYLFVIWWPREFLLSPLLCFPAPSSSCQHTTLSLHVPTMPTSASVPRIDS